MCGQKYFKQSKDLTLRTVSPALDTHPDFSIYVVQHLYMAFSQVVRHSKDECHLDSSPTYTLLRFNSPYDESAANAVRQHEVRRQ